MEELISVVTLLDEEGKEVRFDHLMTFEHEGGHYVALLPMDEGSGLADDEVLIMRVDESGKEDIYVPIEDSSLLDEVFSTFAQLWEEELDAEDDE